MFEHKVGVAVGVVKLASEEDLKGFNAFKVDKKTKSTCMCIWELSLC